MSGLKPGEVEILQRFARGVSVVDIAAARGVPAYQVRDILAELIGGDGTAEQAIALLKVNSCPTTDLDPSTNAAKAMVPAPAVPVLPKRRTYEDVLTEGDAHPAQRIRSLAAKARQQIEVLDELLTEDKRVAAAQARVADARAKLAEAEAALAKAKGTPSKPRPTKARPPRPDGEATPAEMRAWAAKAKVPCPPVGRVPILVRRQYEAAHGKAPAVKV